ncbi:hypothetical protein DRH13_03140 [Candidatus Woesebacteria bacterium]|nr:MAG: hypothetical protein DRH13_03140 [Candidatus Woesebacteria bacterium]
MAKGGGFERIVCKRLSLWWTNNKRDDIFWRSTQSGGRATTRAKKGVTTANSSGDMCYLDAIGKPFIDGMIVELKRGYGGGKKRKTKEVKVLEILDNSTKKNFLLLEWLKKLEMERIRSERKYSWLIFRRDRMNGCIVLDLTQFIELEKLNGSWHKRAIIFSARKNYIIILLLEDFLKWCPPTTMKAIIAGYPVTRKIKRRKKK